MKSKDKYKLIKILVIFLLLVPFRLPIAVLFIDLITWIAELAAELNDKILVANIVVTKLIYDLALSLITVWNLEMLTISIRGRKPWETDQYVGRDYPDNVKGYTMKESIMYWSTGIVIAILACYIIFDCVTTYDLYFELNKQHD